MRLTPLALLTAWLLTCWPALADAPPLIPVQGYLVDVQGLPLDGPVDLTFRLFDAESGGNQLWTEVQQVQVAAGLFTAYLGQVDAVDLALFRDHAQVWLEIQVAQDTPMERVRLGTTPWAGYAQYTDAQAGIPAGLVAIFESSCPAGWTRVAAFDGRVLRGAAAAGATGGADTHLHAVDPPAATTAQAGDHGHSVNWTSRSIDHNHSVNPPGTNTSPQSTNHTHGYDPGNMGATQTSGISVNHTHNVDIGTFNSGNADPGDRYPTDTAVAGSHSHSVDVGAFDSAAASSWPPWAEVVFCRKDAGRLQADRAPSAPSRIDALEAQNRDLRSRLERIERTLDAHR